MKNVLISKIELIDSKFEELTGKEILMVVSISIDLDSIICIREIIEDGETEPSPGKCKILLSSGYEVTVLTPYDEVFNLRFKNINSGRKSI